jgi:hypothetical protein
MALMAHLNLAGAPALYHPAGLPGLSSLSSLFSHISTGAARSERAPGLLFDDCFRRLSALLRGELRFSEN